MIPFIIGPTVAKVALGKVKWLVEACGRQNMDTDIEILKNGHWGVDKLSATELELCDYTPTHLVRVQGVQDCPLLGYELEDIDRYLGIPRPCADPEVRDNRNNFSLRHIRVMLWKRVSNSCPEIPPVLRAYLGWRAPRPSHRQLQRRQQASARPQLSPRRRPGVVDSRRDLAGAGRRVGLREHTHRLRGGRQVRHPPREVSIRPMLARFRTGPVCFRCHEDASG